MFNLPIKAVKIELQLLNYISSNSNPSKSLSEFQISLREENTVNLLGVSEEARIRADKETQESWEVVMNSNIPDVTDEEQLIFFEVR